MSVNYIPKTGDVILLNRKGKESSWYSVAQRFFTKMPYTHAAIILEDILTLPSVLSSDELVNVVPLQNYLNEENTDIEIYTLKGFDVDKIFSSLVSVYMVNAGKSYGFLQVVWFVYRWFMESVFQKDVRKYNNPFKSGEICSELVYHYLSLLSEPNSKLGLKISEWNADTIHAGDIANICKSLPEIFELKYKNF